MESEDLLPCSQKPTTGLYPGLEYSSLKHVYLKLIWIFLSDSAPISQVIYFLKVFLIFSFQFLTHISCLYYGLKSKHNEFEIFSR